MSGIDSALDRFFASPLLYKITTGYLMPEAGSSCLAPIEWVVDIVESSSTTPFLYCVGSAL